MNELDDAAGSTLNLIFILYCDSLFAICTSKLTKKELLHLCR